MVEEGRMSQEEEQEEELSNDKLNEGEIRELVKKALKEGSHEAMFILVLSEWNRPGSSFTDWGKFEALYGEIEKIFLDHIYDYPTTNEYSYAIIPKSKLVIILFQWANDYQGQMEEHEELYVFTYATGWKSISLS